MDLATTQFYIAQSDMILAVNLPFIKRSLSNGCPDVKFGETHKKRY
jgi:hypothetical protein